MLCAPFSLLLQPPQLWLAWSHRSGPHLLQGLQEQLSPLSPTCLPTLPFICILILTSSCTWLPAPLGSGFCQLQGTCNTPYEKKEAMFHPKHKHTQSCQSFPLHSWVALSTKEQVCLLNACIHICKYVHAQMLMYIKGRLNWALRIDRLICCEYFELSIQWRVVILNRISLRDCKECSGLSKKKKVLLLSLLKEHCLNCQEQPCWQLPSLITGIHALETSQNTALPTGCLNLALPSNLIYTKCLLLR